MLPVSAVISTFLCPSNNRTSSAPVYPDAPSIPTRTVFAWVSVVMEIDAARRGHGALERLAGLCRQGIVNHLRPEQHAQYGLEKLQSGN